MSQSRQILMLLAFTLLGTSTAKAQHHHFPNISGRYDTNSPENCTIVQDGKAVYLSSELAGVSHFEFSGIHGQRRSLTSDRKLYVSMGGFHGQYRISYAEGRSPADGYASIVRTQHPDEWRVHFFDLEGSNLIQVESRMITRIGSLPIGQVTGVTNDPNDEFNLLSEDDLDDLGI